MAPQALGAEISNGDNASIWLEEIGRLLNGQLRWASARSRGEAVRILSSYINKYGQFGGYKYDEDTNAMAIHLKCHVVR
jgi:hypothetical protein